MFHRSHCMGPPLQGLTGILSISVGAAFLVVREHWCGVGVGGVEPTSPIVAAGKVRREGGSVFVLQGCWNVCRLRNCLPFLHFTLRRQWVTGMGERGVSSVRGCMLCIFLFKLVMCFWSVWGLRGPFGAGCGFSFGFVGLVLGLCV